jgi:hypothetical protein
MDDPTFFNLPKSVAYRTYEEIASGANNFFIEATAKRNFDFYDIVTLLKS